MSDTEELVRRERLNHKEEIFDLARSTRRAQMSEEDLQIETERERNYSRRGFGQIHGGAGGDFGGGDA